MAPKKHPAKTEISDRGRGTWLVARYRPVTFFSLRMTYATNKGGKTLLVPTPYAIKMALIDACFRVDDGTAAEAAGRAVFEMVKSRDVRVLPPQHCVVHNTFIKILDHDRDENGGPFKSTIAYREFAFFAGDMHIAIAVGGLDQEQLGEITKLFRQTNTFGKRGSFWQCLDVTVEPGNLPTGYTTERNGIAPESIEHYGATQALDDFGDALCQAKDGFERISTYASGAVNLDQHRILRLTAIPYARISASRRFTWYKRLA